MEIKKLENQIRELLKDKFTPEIAGSFSLTTPPANINADLSSNFALSISKKVGAKPLDIAKELCIFLKAKGFDCEAVNNGFINFHLSDKFLYNFIKEILHNNDYFKTENDRKNINLEFVSANPTGPLHLASGSAASLGDSLARVFRKLGYSIKTEYYINNVGNQVELLGKSLKCRFLNQPIPEDGYHGEYLIEIAKLLPKEAKDWDNAKMSDFAINQIISMQKKDMSDFRVNFDLWFEESQLHKDNLPKKVLEILKEKNMVYEKDGALWLGAKLADEKFEDSDRVLVKSDKKNTYFLNDLAYHMNKFDRGFDYLIDIWGADHHGYIPRMKAGIKALGYNEENLKVIIHQLVYLIKDGKIVKMSKRAGDFVTLRELIEEVGIDACRFFFVMRSPNTHLNFDIDLAKKKTSENPVFYVQYVHARIFSIMENASKIAISTEFDPQFNYKLNEDERKLLLKTLYFEKVLIQCIKDLAVHHIPSYLVELSSLFHSFYDKHKVLTPENKNQAQARIYILKAVQETIKTGLDLIGVSAPNRM